MNPREIVTCGPADRAPAVSIVMPTSCRNRDGGLIRAIESVRGQTFRDFEFVVIDDGSTDGTEAVCREFAARDPRIVYIRHEEPAGLPAVRVNPAIVAARAPYIAFMFDDHVWTPDCIQVLLRHGETSPADVVHAEMEAVAAEGETHILGNWPLSVEWLMHQNLIPAGGTLCRKEFFQRFGLFDPHLVLRRMNDWDLWLRALRQGATFSHCRQTVGRKYGPSSPVAPGLFVDGDYKTAYAYMVDETRLESRSAALRPGAIDSFDVFDPERVMPHLRDYREWEVLERTVYEPFFRSHPQYGYPRPPRHNRRYDAELTGFSLNNPQDVFHDRKRILLVSNCYSRTVEECKRALESQMDAIILSCIENQVVLFQPGEMDLVVLFDCTAPSLHAALRPFAAAGVPIAYCAVHGLDAPKSPGPDPLGHLDLAKIPQLAEALGSSAYFACPGGPWREDQRAGAAALMAQAHLLLRLGGESVAAGMPRFTPVPFIPNAIDDRTPMATGAVRPTLYLGACAALAADALKTLARLLRQTSPEMTWDILVSSVDSVPGDWKELVNCQRIVPTNDPLPRIAARLENAYLVVPESILARHSAYQRAVMEEDLARRGSALTEMGEVADSLSGDGSAAWFRERIERFCAGRRERGAVARPDARALHWTNLALAALFVGLRARSDPQDRYDPRQVRVFINSQMKAGSEMVGLLATEALTALGFEVRACVPQQNVYRGIDDSDLNAWLAARGLPRAVRAPYGMGPGCLEMAEEEALAKAAGLSAWLDEQRVGVTIGSAFISELPLGPPSERLVYMGLYQPTGTCPHELTFLRDRMHGLFSDSRWSTRQWARWMAPPVHWVPYAVPAEHFGPRRIATAGPVRIAVGGTLHDRKRQIEALQTVKTLVSEGYDLHVNFYGYEIVTDYVRQLKALAQESPLHDRVTFHGLVDQAVLARDNDILLVASQDEGLPQTALFGMAGGLLCVACPCGGIAEVVRDGETGFLARGFAVEDLGAALRRCLAERPRWPELVARARALLVEEYSAPIAVNRLLRFLLDGATIAASPGRCRFPVAENRQASPGPVQAGGRSRPARIGHPWQLAAQRTLWNGPDVGRRGVRYRLRCAEDHLSGLQACLSVSLGRSRGTLRLTILAEPSGTVVRQVELDLVAALSHEWVQVRFAPIVDSGGRDFTVLATTELTDGRCFFYEAWPHPVSRPRLLAARIHKRVGNYLGIGLSRGVSPFFPVYGE